MAHRIAKKLLLIGWDAADWAVLRPLMAKGWMPNLSKLVSDGASGSLASIPPLVCPMLWTSAATGKRGHRHGILGFREPRAGDDAVRVPASASRGTKALWNILSQQKLRTHVINWPASHPAEAINGVCVSNRLAVLPAAPGRSWPSLAEVVYPPNLVGELDRFRVRPEAIEPAALLPFVPKAAAIDQESDKRLLHCAMLLARASTIHNAASWVIAKQPWDFAAILYDGIELFCQQFMDYRAPAAHGTSAADVEIYGNVVTAAYCFHDMMLGRLLTLAGPDATILLVSDHGYRSDSARPRTSTDTSDGITASHREQGIWVMHGPDIKPGAEVMGASLLDVTPTCLTLLGLPSAMDMDGRSWIEAINAGDAELQTDRMISWDAIAPEVKDSPATPKDSKDDPSREAIAHLLELGYVDRPDESAAAAARSAREENQYNLAVSLLDAGQISRAVALLEPLVRGRPNHLPFARTLFTSYMTLRRYRDARLIVEAAVPHGAPTPLMHIALAAVEQAERRAASALEHLQQAEQGECGADVLVLVGQGYVRLRRWADAERAFDRAVRLDGDNASGWHGLATTDLAQDRPAQAVERALRAIELRPAYAEAHYHLGTALAALGKPSEAAIALRRCLSLRPTMLAPYRGLIELFDGPLNDPAQARAYRREAHNIILQRRLGRRPPR